MLNIELEDPHIIPDLRTLNSSASSAKINRSWSECEAILNEKVGVAVDNHHHTEVTHLTSVISIRDLWKRVKQRLPTHPNSQPRVASCVHLQFWLKTKHAMKTLH